jgi:prolyl oligopeptidase
MTTAGAADRVDVPVTKKNDLVETLHGVKVADPYRWLEDANAPETKNWVQAQNRATFAYLATIPERERIKEKLTRLWNYERYSSPSKVGKYYFFSKNDGLQNQSVLYVSESLHGTPRVLLDPNKLSTDGTIALSGTSVSDDGEFLAYSVSKGGSDWQEWRVRRVKDGQDLTDRIEWAKFTGAGWSRDGKGFYYSRYDAPKEGAALQAANYFQKLYYHRLGTPQSQDTLVYERPDQKEWGFGGFETEDGRYLLNSVWKGTERQNLVFYRDLKTKDSKWVELLPKWEASYSYLANNGPVFFFRTDKDAPRGRIIAIDLRRPDPKDWKTVVPQAEESLESSSVVGDSLFTTYLKDAVSLVKEYDLNGKLRREVKLPGVGTVGGFGGRRKDRETFFSFVGYTSPSTIYRYDLTKGTQEVFKKPQVAFDGSQYETRQVFYASKDGTKVPLFITLRKGTKLDGSNPTLLYGYGGFNSSMTPFYSARMATWLEMGGVLAVAAIRGGGEYGKAWHDAGRLANKQNTFDDFIAAGEYLVKEGYTSPAKLACHGGSNGGLLVGAVVNQRPDLWGAALPAVGVMDMLRFHKFTIGWAWVSDYGSPDKEADFKALLAYSPLHNLKSGTKYPATLITTGDHDDRVVPAHSFKYAAAMQAAQAGDAPVLIRIETSAGHGAGKPTTKAIEEATDQWAFLVRNLGMKLR